MTLQEFRKKVYMILEPSIEADRVARAFNIFIITVIVINCFALVFETVDEYYEKFSALFNAIEVISIIIFTVEYILRLWSCTAYEKYKDWFNGRLKYMFRPMMIVDLAAIIPFYIVSLGVDLRSIRIIRIFRVFRILKLGNYSKSAQIMINVLRSKKADLVITIFISIILIFISSFVVYVAEHETQPDRFNSITAAFWWALATLTPGPPAYEFFHPITTLGKLAGGIIQILGIALIALPTGILGAGFNEEMQKYRTKKYPVAQNQDRMQEGVNFEIKKDIDGISGRLDKIEKSLEEIRNLSDKKS